MVDEGDESDFGSGGPGEDPVEVGQGVPAMTDDAGTSSAVAEPQTPPAPSPAQPIPAGPPRPALQRDVERMRNSGGFTAGQINTFIDQQRPYWRCAGLTEQQIDNYYGVKPFDMSTIHDFFTDAARDLWGQGRTDLPSFDRYWTAGWRTSVTDLGWMVQNHEHPEAIELPEDSPILQRYVQGLAQVTGDAPFAALGFLGAGGPADPVVATGAAMALPAGLRVVLMDAYNGGQINNFSDFWTLATKAAWASFKAGVVGVATGGVGLAARGVAAGEASAANAAMNSALQSTAVRAAARVAQAPAELATMTTVGAMLEGRMPSARDFVNNATILLGLHVTRLGVDNLWDMYDRMGVDAGPKPVPAARPSTEKPLMDMAATGAFLRSAYRQLGDLFVKHGVTPSHGVKLLAPHTDEIAKIAERENEGPERPAAPQPEEAPSSGATSIPPVGDEIEYHPIGGIQAQKNGLSKLAPLPKDAGRIKYDENLPPDLKAVIEAHKDDPDVLYHEIRNWMIAKTEADGAEHWLAFNKASNAFEHYHTSGDARHVRLESKHQDALWKSENQYHIFHTHPLNSPLSGGDLGTLIRSGQVKATAFGSRGDFSTALLRPHVDAHLLRLSPQQGHDLLVGISKYKETGDPLYEANQLLHHSTLGREPLKRDQFLEDIVNRTLAKYDIIDYEGSHHFMPGYEDKFGSIPEGLYDDVRQSVEKNLKLYLTEKGLLK